MKNLIASISCLDSINQISSLMNNMLFSSDGGFVNLTSKEAINNVESYIKKFDYEVFKIQKGVKFPLENEIIKIKKKEFLTQIEKHYSKQVLLWAQESYEKFIDNLFLELSIEKANANNIFNNLVKALNWYSSIKNFSKTQYQLEFSCLQEKFNTVLRSQDNDFLPKMSLNKTNPDEFILYWDMVLDNQDKFIKNEFLSEDKSLIQDDIQFFQTLKNKILSQKATAILDELILINSAISVLNLSDNKEKYAFIKEVLFDFNSQNKKQAELSEEEKIKLIKRRMLLLKDKNKSTKEYFKKLITSS